ncbi:MAG: TonB-dependent receptor [Acidobacteria bacterium]|nr:TonB-dependent receptor [Acidobacteriota bacterium]
MSLDLFHPFHRLRYLVLVVAAVLSVASGVAAQTLSVEGTVRDTTGAALPNAQVEARSDGPVKTATANEAGQYRIDGLAPGRYTVTAAFEGFVPTAATVDLGRPLTSVDLTFTSLTMSESLTVTAALGRRELDSPTPAGSRLGLTPRETPATVDVITFTEAQERGLRTALEALSSVPAVTAAFLPSAQGITTIRGFSGGAVSQLFDGTRVTTSTIVARNYDSWSFDRIEVLKGPASVLYGEGALAGAVNFVPKRPDFGTRRGEALISYGSLGTGRFAAGTTGPLANGRAAYRADVVFNRTAGYVQDSTSDNLQLDGAIDVKLGRTATLGIAVDHFRDDYGSAYFGTPIVPRAFARQPSDIVTDSRGWVLDESLRDVNYNVNDAVVDVRTTWVRSKLDWQIAPTWKLANELFFYDKLGKWRGSEVYGFDTASALMTRSTVGITHDHQFYGNRLTVASDRRFGTRRNRFTVGFEANRNDFLGPRRFGVTTSVDPFAPSRGSFPADETAANFPGAGNRTDFTAKVNLVSAFVEDAFSVAPRVTVVAGARRDGLSIDRGVNDLNTGVQAAFVRDFDPVSWRTGVVVDALPRTQLFGQYTSAVAPVATILLISQGNAAFNLTNGWSWEGGVKSTLASGRLDATASVFKIQQDDIITRDPNNFNVSIQGGAQASTGVEFSVSADPLRGLRLNASAAVMDARFVTLLEAGGVNRAGNVPPNTPERTAGFWASYTLPNLPMTLVSGVRYQGRFFTNNANSTEVAGVTLLDAQAIWRLKSGDVTLRGRNLTDALYADWTGASANQVQLGAPRTVDLSYHVRF